MRDRFEGKTVFVTGAARGLGLEIARRFHQEGANIVAADIRAELLAATWRQEVRVLQVVVDVTDRSAVDSAVTSAVKRFGRIDVLANVAGIALEQPFLEISAEDWRRIIDVNLTGTFLVAQAVARQMARQHPSGGVIINMASKNGITAEVKYAHYNASKAGVILLTQTMAGDLAEYNIRVNAVAPGYCLTPLTEEMDPEAFRRRYSDQLIPLARLGKPEEIAGTFAFLASEDAGFITGATILVDGGHLAIDGRKMHAWDDITP
jgi:3-oxoacyl-[acyl-carrier protein] reductase